MKNTLKFSVAALALAIAVVSFNGCKKGEEDPGISFKSRKGRVAGDWTLSAMDITVTTLNTYNDPDSLGNAKEEYTSHDTFDGTNYSETSFQKDTEEDGDYSSTTINAAGGSITTNYADYASGLLSSVTATGTYSHTRTITYTLGKDGKFEAKMISKRNTSVTAPSNILFNLVMTTSLDETTEFEGTWAFIGKDKTNEFKNKERIAIWYTTVTTTSVSEDKDTYTDKIPGGTYFQQTMTNKNDSKSTDTYKNSAPDEVWELVELKNKEMKIISTGSTVSAGNNTNYVTAYNALAGTQITTSYASTYNQKTEWTMTGTLTAK